tara:strand:- start:74 stop:1123 length:1050 start_codon:yes stop_codon:yes gene_type:complete
MLYQVPTLVERAKLWYELTGKEIKVVICDLHEAETMRSFFDGRVTYTWCENQKFTGIPETVVHYAEQPSAPFSMISYKHSNATIQNNLLVTNNLMYAVRDYNKETHIIKLGTMGEYGTPNIDIEEGWIDIKHKGRKDKFLFPRSAGSIYHTSKIMDTDLLWFGVRTWDLRVTDLMQGPVYGIDTDESSIDERLLTFFNYDEVFGTVINRFITQAVSGYPLSIYGKGGQTRGYINIKDTLQCVEHSERIPAKQGEFRIFNQIMETFSVLELAEKIIKVGKLFGLELCIEHIQNPRKEKEKHYYNPTYQGLLDIGVKPHYLTNKVLKNMLNKVNQHKENIKVNEFYKGIKW